MAQTINTNISSLNAQRNLNNSQSANRTSLERLSSGLRINSAKDDAAGLAISTRFTSQIKGLSVAIRNAGDGISLAQTAEGALSSMTSNLQRIRELALQSSNATNSDVDREALNAEAQQLISEITRSGEQSNFNGTNLLDGNFNASFQIGANRGETVSFGIAELTASSLGGARSAGMSAQGTGSALGNGDLVINGAVVGASVASDDTSSVADQEKSAISKVATINRVSDESGVVATVDTNTVAGSIQVAAATTGSIELNGVSISVATGGVDAAADRQAVVAAINARSNETGVTAIDQGTLEGGVTLEAADGRNITLGEFGGTVTSESTGLAAANDTYTGGFTLTSVESGTPIVLAEGTGDITNAGLAAGTFAANTSSMTTVARVGSGDDSIASLRAGDMEINGVSIGASRDADDTASNAVADSSTLSGSGISIAAAINRSTDVTGVTALVNATVVSGGTTTTAATGTDIGASGDIYINNVNVGTVTLTGDGEQDRGAAIDLINSKSGQTGVVATDNGGAIDLTAADGRNISVAIDSKATANTLANGAGSAFEGASIGLSGAGIGEADLTGGASLTSAGTGIVGATYDADATFSIDLSLNDGDAQTISVAAGSAGTQADFLSALNTSLDTAFGADTVTASVVDDKLVFTTDSTGTAESLQVSTAASGTLAAASITMNAGLRSEAVNTYANTAETTTSTIRLESSKAFSLQAGTNGESSVITAATGASIVGTADLSTYASTDTSNTFSADVTVNGVTSNLSYTSTGDEAATATVVSSDFSANAGIVGDLTLIVDQAAGNVVTSTVGGFTSVGVATALDYTEDGQDFTVGLTLNGVTQSITTTESAATTGFVDEASFLTALNADLDTAFGAGAVVASIDSGEMVLTTANTTDVLEVTTKSSSTVGTLANQFVFFDGSEETVTAADNTLTDVQDIQRALDAVYFGAVTVAAPDGASLAISTASTGADKSVSVTSADATFGMTGVATIGAAAVIATAGVGDVDITAAANQLDFSSTPTSFDLFYDDGTNPAVTVTVTVNDDVSTDLDASGVVDEDDLLLAVQQSVDNALSAAMGTDYVAGDVLATLNGTGLEIAADAFADGERLRIVSASSDDALGLDSLVAVNNTGETADTIADVAAAFSTVAGVTATTDGGVLTITGDATGSDQSVSISNFSGGGGAFTSLASLVGGSATGVSAKGTAEISTTTGLGSVGLKAGTFGGSETGQFLTDVDLTSVKGALSALDAVDNALQSVSSERANLGAIQNRLQSTIDNLSINVENLQAANSRILDADFAAETAELSRTQVLQQAGISILAQANAAPQQVLALLQ